MSINKNAKDKTKAVHLGRTPARNHQMVNTPVYRASTVLFPTLADMNAAIKAPDAGPYYGRRGTETTNAFRDSIAELENGHGSVVYPSGLAAVTQSMLAFLQPGDHVLITDTAYEPTRGFCDKFLTRNGIETTYYDPLAGAGIGDLCRENTRIVFTEAPGSLTFEMQDIPAITQAAHDKGALVFMDNTWATPLFFKPLDHGVDVVIHAATKYIVGHSDVMLGVATTTREHWPTLQRFGMMLGQCASPDDIYLAHRGLRTLAARMPVHQENGIKLAQWLQKRPEVERVMHPALPEDPGHELWQRDFTGASGLFSVHVRTSDERPIAALVDELRYFGMGFSWGGYESLVLPMRPQHAKTLRTATTYPSDNFLLRFHAGLEDIDDLTADLEEGFERYNKAL